MKRLVILSAALIGVLFASPVLAAKQNGNEYEMMIPFKSGGTIDIQNYTGEVVVRTWDKPEVKLRYVKLNKNFQGKTAESTYQPSVVETKTFGDNLKIFNKTPGHKQIFEKAETVNGNSYDRFDYYLWVPKKSNLNVKTSKGHVNIQDLDGKCEISTTAGKIKLHNIMGPVAASSSKGYIHLNKVNGNADLTTTAGDITANEVNGHVNVSTSSGDIKLSNIVGPVKSTSTDGAQDLASIEGKPMIETISGNIRLKNIKSPAIAKTESGKITVVTLDSNVAEASTFKSGTGTVYLRDVRGNADIQTASANTEIKAISGDVKFNSDHGNLDVASLYGTVTAKSNTGNIEIKAKAKNFDKPLKLETKSGDIALYLPASTPADVTLKTSQGEIKTQFPIDSSRAPASHEANGQINGGGEKVFLYSQSGDIMLNSF